MNEPIVNLAGYVFRYGSKTDEPSGEKRKNVGAEVQ